MATATTKATPTPQSDAGPPLFYSRPVPISPETFKGKSFVPTANREFARKTNLVPLNVTEFALAQHHYPIVFSHAGGHFPMAILGIRTDQNLFVGADGRWEANVYVPAYVRRYPFILMGKKKDKQFALCADVGSAFVTEGDASPFFRDGKPVEAVNKAAQFCRAFQAEADKTVAFSELLAEQKLLREKAVELEHPSGRKFKLGPFRIVDEKKLKELPAKIVADWNTRGLLAPIYAHLFSLANWSSLANRMPPQ
jgi:hypothetical protein